MRFQQASELQTRVEAITASGEDSGRAAAPRARGEYFTMLFNPFSRIRGGMALMVGLAAILFTGLLGSLSGAHFDGVLDTHVGAGGPRSLFLLEGILDWLCLFGVLLIAGKLASKAPMRIMDLLGTQALARWPDFLICVLTLSPGFQRAADAIGLSAQQGRIESGGPDAIVFLAVTAAMVPIIVWVVWLMYRSYETSSGLKGGKAVATFIAAILVAEILSRLAISALAASLDGRIAGNLGTVTEAQPKSDAEQAALPAAKDWLKMIDARDYSGSWNQAARAFQAAVTVKGWGDSLKKYREPAGDVVLRKLLNIRGEVPPGNYVIMQFQTDFTKKHSAVETVTFVDEKDGPWKAAGYFIK